MIPCVLQMRLLLEEFVNSGDVTEAIRCLKELDVPHFHHELVYEVRGCVKVNKIQKIVDNFNKVTLIF